MKKYIDGIEFQPNMYRCSLDNHNINQKPIAERTRSNIDRTVQNAFQYVEPFTRRIVNVEISLNIK